MRTSMRASHLTCSAATWGAVDRVVTSREPSIRCIRRDQAWHGSCAKSADAFVLPGLPMNSSAGRFQVLMSVAAFVVAIAGLKYAAGFLVPVLLGSMIAAASAPLLIWLLRRVPPILAATLVLFVDIIVLGLT